MTLVRNHRSSAVPIPLAVTEPQTPSGIARASRSETTPEPRASGPIGRLVTRIAWRSERRIVTKLMGFAATELGSSLDMIRASEQTTDPRLRRLYYRHGLDEARHAQAFREAARRLNPAAAEHTRSHEKLHALRQDLHERLGEIGFVAFVYLAESKARRHFARLADHFAAASSSSSADLANLFREIGKDEHTHCAYSRRLLDEWRSAGRRTEVARALRKVRLQAAWRTWRNSGRRIGDLAVRVMLATLFVTIVPIFALLSRLQPAARKRGAIQPTWHAAPAANAPRDTMMDRLRSQF